MHGLKISSLKTMNLEATAAGTRTSTSLSLANGGVVISSPPQFGMVVHEKAVGARKRKTSNISKIITNQEQPQMPQRKKKHLDGIIQSLVSELEAKDKNHESDSSDDGLDMRPLLSNSDKYKCIICSFGSLDKGGMLRHMRVHGGERPWQCRLCFFAFTTKANCERHLRNRHGLIDPDQLRNLVVSNSLYLEDKPDIYPDSNEEVNVPLDLSVDAMDLSIKKRTDEPKVENLHRPRPLYPNSGILERSKFSVGSLLGHDLTFAPPPLMTYMYPYLITAPEYGHNGPINGAPLDYGISPKEVVSTEPKITSTAIEPVTKKKGTKEPHKPKQRRYRTERPFACPHCPARFTLRSNMERHGKHQHPQVWQRSPSNRVINRAKNLLHSKLGLPPPNPKAAPKTTTDNGHGLNVRAVIAQQLKRKMSNMAEEEDLASVGQLIDRANDRFCFERDEGEVQESDDEGSSDGSEEGSDDGSGQEGSGQEGSGNDGSGHEGSGHSQEGSSCQGQTPKKKSAYSSAPHKICCPHCSRKFPWSSSLRRHLLTHSGVKPYSCLKCPLLFTTKSNCDRHLARKHSATGEGRKRTRKPIWTRAAQRSASAKKRKMLDPMKRLRKRIGKVKVQEVQEETVPEPKETTEPIIEKKSPNSSPSSDSDVAFRCHLCEASSPSRQVLLGHMETQHPETYKVLISKGALRPCSSPNEEDDHASQRKVICAFCVRRFWSVEDLRRHVRSHSGERPFSCPHCSRRFTLKHSMLRHLKKHGHLKVDAQVNEVK